MNPHKHDGTGTALCGARVLIIEDDFFIAVALQTILMGAGAEAAPLCATVSAALSFLRENEPSAAILDIQLGLENVAPVARELARRRTPFMFYTGQVETGLIEREWPGSPVIAKPAMPQTIIGALAMLLDRGSVSTRGQIAACP